jgi:hypothetical protein
MRLSWREEKFSGFFFGLSGGARAIFSCISLGGRFEIVCQTWESHTGLDRKRECFNNLRAKEMSRGRCLRDVSDPPGHLDDAGGLGKLLPLRTPPTAPTPVSRDEADQPTHNQHVCWYVRKRNFQQKYFLVCVFDGWMDRNGWMDGKMRVDTRLLLFFHYRDAIQQQQSFLLYFVLFFQNCPPRWIKRAY